MLPNLVRLITGRPSPEVDRLAFVEEVRVDGRVPRNPQLERLILGGWLLITVKHVLIIWACQNYPVPFHQLWVNAPTWLLGALATGIYFARVRRS